MIFKIKKLINSHLTAGNDSSVQARGQLGVQVAEDQHVQQGSVRHQCAGQVTTGYHQ